MSRSERRLAAIMFTDVVGYTAAMAESEEKGLRARRRHRELVRPLVRRYHGRSIEARGDESVSVFAAALDAVHCALAIQKKVETDPDLGLHIGIHLGDVVIQGGEISGDGVNIASRICALSEGGGVCVSEEVYQAVRNQPELSARGLGEQDLKNVGRPVSVFSLTGFPTSPRRRFRMRNWAMLAPGAAGLLAILGYVLVSRGPEKPSEQPRPETRYLRSGDVDIAYQILGKGTSNAIFVPGVVAHLDARWEEPRQAAFFRHLASYQTLVLFDKRGTGLSDRSVSIPTLDQRVADLDVIVRHLTAMQSTGLTPGAAPLATLIGLSEGGAAGIAFAAQFPGRVDALVLWNSFATRREFDDHPWGLNPTEVDLAIPPIRQAWGSGQLVQFVAPDWATDPQFATWWRRLEQLSMSPATAADAFRWVLEVDVRDLLADVRVPTLIICARDDVATPPAKAQAPDSCGPSRYMAQHIPGATIVERPGRDHFPFLDEGVAGVIEEFLNRVRSPPPHR